MCCVVLSSEGMKFTSTLLLLFFAQNLLSAACESSFPTAVDHVLLWKTVRGTVRYDECNMTTLAADRNDACVVRGLEYSKHAIFQHVSGCYCFKFMNEVLKPNKTVIKPTYCVVSTSNITYPCFWDTVYMKFLHYNYTHSESVTALNHSFMSSEGISRWRQCSEDAISCCDNMNEGNVYPGEGYCPANWDAWTCWDKSPVQTTQHKACPSFTYSGELPSCQHYSNKECFETGDWNQDTDYSTCTPNSMLWDRNVYHVILLAVSIVVSLPALVIFFSYRKLWVTRVILHRNLVIAIIVRNTFSITVKTEIILDALREVSERRDVMAENSAWCRTLSFMDKLSNSAVYSCLLLEGIFLHRLIAAAFRGHPKMLYYYIGASGLAILPVAVWAAITAEFNDVNCWAVDTTDNHYIFDGPRILALAINAVLMLDIVRVLWTKLRGVNNNKSDHTRRMTRATILLIPLFGVQFLVTLVRPNTGDCDLEQAYYYIFYTMDGLQGTSVALLYCYLNKEVQVQLLGTYNLLKVRFYRLLGKDYQPQRHTTWAYSEQRPTASSLIPQNDSARTSEAFPSKDSHARSSRPSLIVGSAPVAAAVSPFNQPDQPIFSVPPSVASLKERFTEDILRKKETTTM